MPTFAFGNYVVGSGRFPIGALPARGIAHASRNNIIGELGYGSYPATIRSEPAPEDIIPRRR
jgi:hypothetical protein